MLADIARAAAFRKPDEDPEGIYEVGFNHNTIIQNSMLHQMNLFFIAGDNSGAGMQENLMDNEGAGMICESEADTVSILLAHV